MRQHPADTKDPFDEVSDSCVTPNETFVVLNSSIDKSDQRDKTCISEKRYKTQYTEQ